MIGRNNWDGTHQTRMNDHDSSGEYARRNLLCLGAVMWIGATLGLAASSTAQETSGNSDSNRTLRVLFIGNSYTARHNLADLVKQLAELSEPGLTFEPTQVIYGGRTLKDHWRLGTQHVVNRADVTAEEVSETIAALEEEIRTGAKDQYAPRGLARMRELLEQIQGGTIDRSRWDWIVLQSYRDDLDGEDSSYMQYAPRYAAIAANQKAKVLLYETTPTTQNQYPIAQHQDASPVMKKAASIARLARSIDSTVAPMSYVALQAQIADPEITLRFVNDAHLNQTMAYLTACTIYAAMFDRSPEGLRLDSVTDIRFWKNDRATGRDRDNQPIKRSFDQQQRSFLQSTSWKALHDFHDSFSTEPGPPQQKR